MAVRLCRLDDLAEGAARLLVGQHALQRVHLRRQLGDVLLRAVDHRQPRMQLLQMVAGVLGRGLHRLAEILRHRVEPLVHGLLQSLHVAFELGDALLRRRIGHRRARPQQERDDGDDADRDDQSEDEEDGVRHALLLA